ncbi:DUF3307 domain-containing protein [Pseudoalteromonas byunsanensis]|uniref:DUF3307 domain-containing protein n=1 Tax=Pseudoalteromonas byunsanensis TaxID=327939 RepID=A0A1S1MZ22_9GAMM|nr:DUF3307 domain-containing protein [Pseudoalteromonas byunsanensis]OHU94025.1 hypothetical protein BIW53_17550 [Pseudoalteromonas byunsanensis]
MDLLLLLISAHFVGDFYLQPTAWVMCRNTRHIKSAGLWKHFLVHLALNTLVFLLADFSFWQASIAVMIIAFSHLLMDYIKSHLNNSLRTFLLDQGVHLVIICLVWIYLSEYSLSQIQSFLSSFISNKNIIIGLAYLLACKPASIIIALALKKHTDSLTASAQQHANSGSHVTHEPINIGLISAGAWIGYIERCLAISFIFMGQFAGIGFLVAAKTIFRFGDLTKNKDMKLTEYMMLGTLFSYAIALFIGWHALRLYQLFP